MRHAGSLDPTNPLPHLLRGHALELVLQFVNEDKSMEEEAANAFMVVTLATH